MAAVLGILVGVAWAITMVIRVAGVSANWYEVEELRQLYMWLISLGGVVVSVAVTIVAAAAGL